MAITHLDFYSPIPYDMVMAVPQVVIYTNVLNDPNDEMVLELAMAARCHYIVAFYQRDFGGRGNVWAASDPSRSVFAVHWG